ncbi:hypothetical protein ACFQ3L_00920 [Lacticaseibacillus jixianensis]|uniref:Chromosome segregation protein SMC n=1 Tax=Lacticaseibacillus jixianensis TaxID=2486012 RepID=A0ABW4B9N0_9LACO|nr:hypothetical protein [Lacticaseibacillus jixianensis]
MMKFFKSHKTPAAFAEPEEESDLKQPASASSAATAPADSAAATTATEATAAKSTAAESAAAAVTDTPLAESAATNADATPSDDVVVLKGEKAADPEQAQITAAENTLTRLTKEYNKARTRLQTNLFAKQSKLNSELAAEQKALAALDDAKPGKEKALKQLQASDDSAFTDKMTALNGKAAKLAASIKEQQAALSQVEDGIAETKQAVAELKQQSTRLDDNEQAISEKLHAETDPMKLVDLADANRQKLSEIQLQREKIAKQTADHEAKLTDLKQAQKTQTTALEDLESQQGAIKDEIASLKHNAELAKTDQTKQIKALEAALKANAEDRAKAQTRIAALEDQLEMLGAQIQQWLGTAHQVAALSTKAGKFVIALDSFLPAHADTVVAVTKRLLAAGVPSVGVYSSFFDINLAGEMEAWAYQNGIEQDRIEIVNALYALQSNTDKPGKPVTLPKDIKASSFDQETWVQTVELADGSWTLEVKYQPADEDTIQEIGYVQNGTLTKRSFFNQDGILSANANFVNGMIQSEEYFRQDGIMVLRVTYDQGKQLAIEMFDEAGLLQRTFPDTEALSNWWLKTNFPDDARLIGSLGDDHFSAMVQATGIQALPYVAAEHTAFAPLTGTAFIAQSQANVRALSAAAGKDIQVLLLDRQNLPLSLATPE